jgi:hypothetical protein
LLDGERVPVEIFGVVDDHLAASAKRPPQGLWLPPMPRSADAKASETLLRTVLVSTA